MIFPKNAYTVFMFEYELNKEVFTAHIAAETAEKADEYLRQQVGNVRCTQTGSVCSLSAVSDSIDQFIVDNTDIKTSKKKRGPKPQK